MLVFLDTNILYRDFSLRSTPFRFLFEGMLVIEKLRVIVPQVVIDETVANFVERVAEEYDKESAATQKLARLLDSQRTVHERPTDLAADGALYRLRLLQRLMYANCEVAGYPEVDHRTIVQREVSRKAPFTNKGGYRDYLIWSTLLEHAAKADPSEEFHLVTANSHDFCEGSRLHPDLAADLPKNVNVRVHLSLENLNAECIRPHMEAVATLTAKLEGDDVKRELESWLEHELSWYDDMKLDNTFNFSDERGRARVRSTQIRQIDVTEKVKLANGNVWLELDIDGKADVDVTTRLDDFVLQREALQKLQFADVEPGEWNWNEDCAFNAHASLILEPSTQHIIEGGVHSLSINGAKFDVDQGISRPW